MNREQREQVISDLDDELEKMSDRLLALEEWGKENTPLYKGQLQTYEKKLEYYDKVVSRHEVLCEEESGTKK